MSDLRRIVTGTYGRLLLGWFLLVTAGTAVLLDIFVGRGR